MDAFGLGAHAIPTAQGLGWGAFTDLDLVTSMLAVLVLSVVLAAAVAYHPALLGRASTLEDLEQPKTLIMYAVVGATIAVIVRAQPSMALVVFGIGGLLRFRTNVGEAKDTGRVILVTVVGLCCGLQLYVVGTLATAFGWTLIALLEWHAPARVVVQGLGAKNIEAAAEAYTQALREAGAEPLGAQLNVRRGTVALLYRAPRGVDRQALRRRFAEVPEPARGIPNWE